ncbi:response regulator [Methylocystis hirsuta]|uniref:histidine kinase n=1 Tax=Methylocystis hirsuta TaxID=369798 RepID=A0A3M9XK39_9HYPH|nr:response regulator [Methylocystis hirsuta]RNJ47982.1 response regulator [Methylocystis hirsuta]
MSTTGTSLNYLVDHSSLRASHGLDDSTFDDVRAVGGSMSARVPELIDDFYEWLSSFPEFGQFLSGERLLARLKAKQGDYWRDFLRAGVDEAYVERRRVIGQVHARIELGLLIYLLAMEFISAWLTRAIEADESLRDRPTAALSIRKLIAFDSAIVVDTYGARTARSLEEHRKRLEHVAGVMQAVTEGDLSHRIIVTGPEDVLGRSLNDMVQSLSNIAREMELIARGDYAAHASPRCEKDELGVSLQAMTRALREAAEKNEQQMWVAETQTALGQAMSGNPSVRELSQRVLSLLCRALDAQVGAQYVVEDGGETLRLTGIYAASAGDGAPDTWKLGEGLVGQAAQENRRIVLKEVPEDSIRIRWGLGEALPRSLVVLPVVHEGEVRGVIELGSLKQFSGQQLDLLDIVAPSVGQAISAAETRARIQQLLEESRAQGEELTTQQDELRQVNDTLEEHTHALELQKESLLSTETVLRQKAAELERTSRYKSEFLANMSHELRTPLNSSLILAKLLSDNKDGNLSPEQVKYAQSISAAGNDLLTLINDILDLSKIEAGKIDLDIAPVAISRLVSGLERRFEPLASERKLEFRIIVNPSCPQTIETDLQRVQQILSNLLSNALKFTEKGAIRLLVAPKDSRRIAFTVEDTGIGIPADQHEVIFKAFQQADGTTNRKFGGTGLGLSISREFAELLGGEIRIHSMPGEGSVFTLLIPLRAETVVAAAPSASPKAEAAPQPSAEVARPFVEDDRDSITDPRRVVLVVEDDPVFAEILRDLARERGFKCIIAGTADGGLRLAREYRPEAVVLDIGLPDQSGLTVLELLKRDSSIRHAPIHVLSVHDYQQVARQMGAVGYILKPVKREQLVSAFRLLEERISRDVKAILIVEDEAVQRGALTNLLASDDIDIVAVATAEEALQQMHSTTFDCVVLDLMLPDVSGFELLDRMSQDESYSIPPVIIYTARSLTVDEEQTLRRLSKSIIVKGARSPERLIEEVTLFLHQAESELSPEKQHMLRVARDRETVLDGRRILLVEDDVRNIFSLTAMLERDGAVVHIARNGREALARLDQEPSIDFILMDIMMPEMDGLEAMREIRKREGSTSLPIIALTAKAMADDRQQCLEAGANDYIAKPIDVEKLLSLIRVWMPK